MCGIAGVIEPKLANKDKIVEAMVSRIIHRGPDEDGFYVDKNVGLGMRRLSIIDLSTGRQPITSEDEKFLIVFNGEIYNYLELKEGLLKKGYKFKTDSDTEVILHMYEEYGEKMLVQLRGMFTFCIYNTESKEVFIARDFFGIKPLYYLVADDSSSTSGQKKVVAFSSEAKSFLSFPGFFPKINDDAVYNYLSFQYNPLAESFFKDVYKLPPAHFMKIDLESGSTEIKKYWSFEFKQDNKLDEKKTKIDLLYTIKDSVRHHMIADVPVGAFLSGGVDSSIITTLMQEIRGEKKIKTFTVGWDILTEGAEAKETSDVLGTDHKEIKISPEEFFSVLGKAVYHFDEPVADPSAIGIYFLAREAKKSVKVVLSGEGSDELFGGYNIYLAPQSAQKMTWLPKVLLDFLTKLPFHFYGKNYLKRVNTRLEDWYFGQKYFNQSIFERGEIKKIWKGKKTNFISMNSIYKNTSKLSDSTKMQYVDINTWLVGDILAKADKMTMANSLELRVPFLDTKVADLAKTLPDYFKWRNGVTKHLLREAFSRIIPESTKNRRKLGFPTPIAKWLNSETKEVYNSILNNKYIKENMDTVYIKSLIDEHNSNKKDNSRKIYTLLMLSLWYDTFITDQP